MLELRLVTIGVTYEEHLAREMFEYNFGDPESYLFDYPDFSNTEDQEKFQKLEDTVFDILMILENSLDSSFLLISDEENSRSIKIDDYEDLIFFVKESNAINLAKTATIHDDSPVSVDLSPFSPPEFQRQDPPQTSELTDPFSLGDERGLNLNTDPQEHPTGMVYQMNRLSKFGVSFPHINESALLEDFNRLMRMDEVTDEDLINLMKMGYDELKKGTVLAYNAYKNHKDSKKSDDKDNEDPKDTENKEDPKDSDDSETKEDPKDTKESKIKDLLAKGDPESIKAARSAIQSLKDSDPAEYEKLKAKIDAVADKNKKKS